ncbi:pyrroline-5-carboxylate reductase [Xinfangfangia sp. CPCC 101601]|uniref:Pyrroline-5-carboxylate reductase n=1 Tax=Pseudogemmobacter lacusdianii TaxID=3069608 RepID=A0ABU0VYG7_9RHOB|nr:pyrroline-5-carboxylate reductase [Xinfangfangia sp. CPCC 101601]MDQ2066799.1 pyrroline-5-carboxylate reductase [Xinfangfangia sp. CPCC 101601]
MTLDVVARDGLVLLGCGKMGSALLAGWLKAGLPAASVWVIEPHPSDWLQASGVHLNAGVPPAPAVALLAVKPQMMGDALPALQALGNGSTLFISIAAGTSIATFEAVLGAQTPIVRSMPNTPAMVGRGITAIIGNANTGAADLSLARELMAAVGQVVELQSEDQIDSVTAVSGSGPAYVFHLIEAMADAGVALGLTPEVAMQLARATVSGAGELAHQSHDSAAQLRINVTSPGGTTAAALGVLMDAASGFPPLLKRAAQAASDRGKELGK